ncbi:type VII secretion protein EssC, partial [Enterococcus faecium]|nr:type VII secretion protein EssC [Enterococcus faecium]
VLYLNDESEIGRLLGREVLAAQAISGRGQIMLDVPTAIQFYLPTEGKNSAELLEKLEAKVTEMNQNWTGLRPEKIPMVPEELTTDKFQALIADRKSNTLYLGLNKVNTNVEYFELFAGKSLGLFPANKKQLNVLAPFLLDEIVCQSAEVILVDELKSLETFQNSVSIYISREELNNQFETLNLALEMLLSSREVENKSLIIFNGTSEILNKLGYQQLQFIQLIEQNTSRVQFIFMDYVTNIGNNFAMPTVTVKENVPMILFGGQLGTQHFVENFSLQLKNEKVELNVLHCVKDGEISKIVVPTK